MSRIEKQTPMKEELTKMKGEVVREVRRSGKRLKKWHIVGIAFLVFLVIFGLWVCWLVAATGLVRIPVLTSFAYESPTPHRIIEAGTPLETVAEAQFRSELTKRLQQGGGTIKDDVLVFSASESSFTSSFRTALEESGVGALEVGTSQISIQEEDGLVLFVPLKDSELKTALLVEVMPSVVDEEVILTLTSVQLGSLKVPLFIIAMLFQPMLEAYVNDLNKELAGFATITDVTIQEGWMEITSRFSLEINP
jgi:hypothetical protein